MARREWDLSVDGADHQVVLEHGWISGLRVITLDGLEVYRGREIIDTGGTYGFPIGSHAAAVHILTQGSGVEYSLDIDGRPLQQGLVQVPGQRRFGIRPVPIPDVTDPAAVAAARAGTLSDEQVAAVLASLPQPQLRMVVISVIVLVVGSPILVGALIWGVPLGGAVVIGLMVIGPIILLALQLGSLLKRRRVVAELEGGRIELADGTVHWQGTSSRIEAGGHRLALPSGRRPLAEGAYRFYFLPRSRLVVAAEALAPPEPSPASAGVSPEPASWPYFEVLARSNGFSVAEILLNRVGRMSGRQHRHLLAEEVSAILGLLLALFGAAVAAATTIDSFRRGAWPYGLFFLLFLLGCLVVVLATGYYVSATLVDLLLGHVSFADGQLGRERIPPSGARGYTESFLYLLGPLRFHVSRQAYEALPSPQAARVYYSRAGRELLSLEPLPLLDLAGLASSPRSPARPHAFPTWLYVVTLITWLLAVIYLLLLALMEAIPPMLPAVIMVVAGGFALWDAHTGRGHHRLALFGLAIGAALTEAGIPIAVVLLVGIWLTRPREAEPAPA